MKKLIPLFILCCVFNLTKGQATYSICAGSSTNISTPNYLNLINPSYSLNPGGITSTNGQYVVSPTVTTSYTTYITGSDNTNVVMTETAVITVSVLTQPQTAITLTQATCSSSLNTVILGLSFTPTVSPLTPYSIFWNQIPGNVLSNSQTTINGITAGVYDGTVTTVAGCSSSFSFIIYPQPEPATFSLITPTTGFVVNCFNPTVNITALPGNYNYTWNNPLAQPITGTVAGIDASGIGSWTVTATNPVSGCTSNTVFTMSQNTSTLGSSLAPSVITISCNMSFVPSVSLAALGQTVNISNYIYSPQGGTFVANSHTVNYSVMAPGIYTYCLMNDLNGCKTNKTFTVTSGPGFPTYSATSPQNFTLGCATKSVATILISNGNTSPPGGSISYTLIGPITSTNLPTPTLSPVSAYTVNIPGTWTVVVRDNITLCETKTPVSILINTVTPDISVIVPTQILSCKMPSVSLQAMSQTQNVSYNWSFAGTPGNLPGAIINVNSNSSTTTQSLINTYTLTVTDNNNACKSTSLIPMYQNLYKPKSVISNGGINALTCLTNSIILFNNSSTGIPGNFFPTNLPVIAYEWFGPSPQAPIQVSSTYIAQTVGVYTLTAKDLNNGCTSQTVITVGDNRIYPNVTNPGVSFLPCPGIVALTPIINGPSMSYTYTWSAPLNATISMSMGSPSIMTNYPGFYTLTVTNPSTSCSTSVVFPVYACVGLNSANGNAALISAYPNPGNGLYTIDYTPGSKSTRLEMYNLTGQLIKKEMLVSEKTLLNIQNEANGIYLITVIEDEKKIFTGKLIKQ